MTRLAAILRLWPGPRPLGRLTSALPVDWAGVGYRGFWTPELLRTRVVEGPDLSDGTASNEDIDRA